MPKKRRGHLPPGGKKYRFTKKDCQRGYQAALAKCSQDWNLAAWFHYRVRGFYRRKERDPHDV